MSTFAKTGANIPNTTQMTLIGFTLLLTYEYYLNGSYYKTKNKKLVCKNFGK